MVSALSLLFLVAAAVATSPLDICNSDPSLRITRVRCPHRRLLVAVRKLHNNPYHSLHDSGWAVGHYLHHCLGKPFWPKTWHPQEVHLHLNVSSHMDVRLCTSEPEFYNRTIQPSWGACMLRSVAFEMGIPEENVHLHDETEPPGCFSHTIEFRSRFRPLNYRGRPWKTGSFKANTSVRPKVLPDDIRRRALRRLADSPFKTYLREVVPERRINGRVRLLLYDRKDVRRRQWAQANETVEKLRDDARLEVRHLSKMPHALTNQAQLFRWADVVVTPHGAGLANSIFLEQGADVIEVWKCCREDVRDDPTEARPWTGWHASMIRVGLRYVQCHRMESVASRAELAGFNATDEHEDHWCSLHEFQVEANEVADAVEAILERQIERVARIRRAQWHLRNITQVNAAVALVLVANCFAVRGLRRGKR